MDVEKQGMTNNGFNYTLSPEDFMVSSIWSLPIHGRAALGGKISCATTIATSLKNTVVLLHGPIGCAYQRRINPCRGWNPIYDMPCTALSEAETIYGAYDRLLGAITEVYEKYKPELILVISTDVSDQIGDYMDAVREESQVPCEIVVSTLVSCEQDSVFAKRGVSILRNALITQLLENVDANAELDSDDDKSLNITTLAQLPDDGQRSREFESLVRDMGLHVNGLYFYNNTVHFLLYRLSTGRDPNKQFKEMKKYHNSSTTFERIKGWFESCGIEISEVDYAFKERVSTKKSKLLRAITGFEEDMFILIGEVTKNKKK